MSSIAAASRGARPFTEKANSRGRALRSIASSRDGKSDLLSGQCDLLTLAQFRTARELASDRVVD
jgi:hypothetical protein